MQQMATTQFVQNPDHEAAPVQSAIHRTPAASMELEHCLTTGRLTIRRMEQTRPSSRTNIGFDTAPLFGEVMPDALADAVLAEMTGQPQARVVSRSDFTLEYRGVRLSGLRLLAMAPRNSKQAVILRFREAHGPLPALLADAPGPLPLPSLT